MGQAQEAATLNRQAYLDWEAAQPDKHEYLASEVFAMVGVGRGHALPALAVASRLPRTSGGSRCDTFVSDMKLFVADADAYFYPDVMVTCDESATAAPSSRSSIRGWWSRVLSDSTAACDRGIKFAAYRKLADLQEYLLVDVEPAPPRAVPPRRRALDPAREQETGPPLRLESVDMTLSPAEAFEDLDGEA